MKIIDTHAHLDFPQFKSDLGEVIKNAKKEGVNKIINIGCNAKRAKKAVQIAEQFENVFATVGIHPDDEFKDFEVIEELAKHPKVVGIGETGLDFFRKENPSRKKQEESFLKQINLAKNVNKPVVVHLRNAHDEALEFLRKNHDFPFVVHCFSENLDFANQVIEMGGLISFTGIVTFPNAKEVQEVVKNIPLEKIMLETDCPFLAPQKHRGQRCEPAYTLEIANKIAELKNLSLKEIAETTTKTAERFFGI